MNGDAPRSTPPGVSSSYRAWLREAARFDPDGMKRAARRLDEVARESGGGPAVELLRARVAALLAGVLPLFGEDAAAYSERALQLAKPLVGEPSLPPGCADGVIAEAYLARCAAAGSTAKRAVYCHQGRAAARRALARNPSDGSAHFAIGSFALHAPAVFGGSLARAVFHLERVLQLEPQHRGARLLLTQAYGRQGRRRAYRASLARLAEASPRLAARVVSREPVGSKKGKARGHG